MKKVIAMLACLTMLVSLLVLPATAETAKPLKVAVCVADTLGDRSFYDSAYEGLTMLENEYGVEGSVVECKSDASMFQVALVESAESNDFVVAVGWEFWDALCEVVPAMPETKFIFVDNALDGVGDNLFSIIYAENEGSFLAGYIAMKVSKTGKVGVVGGEDSETINNFIVGYRQGALYANPDGTVADAVYAGTYDDPAKGKECALSLYGAGCDVVFQVAGKTGEGVFEAAAETGHYAIGVDADQKYINPDVIICSMIKRVGMSIYDAIGLYIADGSFAGGTIWDANMSSGLIEIGYGEESMTQQVSDELKAEVEALAQKIIAGEIVVDSTR